MRGLVLLAPFESIQGVLEGYRFWGVLPLTRPLTLIPYAQGAFAGVLGRGLRSHLVQNSYDGRSSTNSIRRLWCP